MNKIQLDGRSLTRSQLVAVAYGAQVELAAAQLSAVARAADFLAEQVRREEPIYGVSTGFGSNADRLLGSHHLRDQLPGAKRSQETLHEELQRNLIVTHAVCVGDAFAPEIVRAMLCIRVNTLMRGHSGIRVETLQALTAMLNAGIVPV
ncbi:aromatic amino acid lyase, partial [Lysobacter sp. 2RAB21]